MKTFDYHRALSVEDAIRQLVSSGGRYLAGGTNLVDLMKNGVEHPPALVDIGRLDLTGIDTTPTGGVLIGARATNTSVANHELVRTQYPVLSQAVLNGATTQIRNMATAGGNLMQRTRCPYFMDPAFTQCNKRSPGSGCGALSGFHREHALMGASGSCVAVHPSDMAVALAVLDAVVHVSGPDGARAIPIDEFFRLPGDTPHIDNTVRPGELITGIELPPSTFTAASWYLKVRDRRSYAFALVSVAAGLDIQDGVMVGAALALGGVAPKPWRVRAAEECLIGRPPGVEVFDAAARLALSGAEPLPQNAFKVDLAKHSVVRTLTLAATPR